MQPLRSVFGGWPVREKIYWGSLETPTGAMLAS
jgi:hypothetical protein